MDPIETPSVRRNEPKRPRAADAESDREGRDPTLTRREQALIGYTWSVALAVMLAAIGAFLIGIGQRWLGAAGFGLCTLALLVAWNEGKYLLDTLREPWRHE